jgi:hypothetical protein
MGWVRGGGWKGVGSHGLFATQSFSILLRFGVRYAKTALTNGNTYQVIGAHLNGVQLKGPAEANGFNVDLTLIPLPCGGHVTPPVGPGPVYHCEENKDPLPTM